MKPLAQQTTWEFEQLLEIVDARIPEAMLEVGVYEGGTLTYWLEAAELVVAIDDTMRAPGPEVWQQWADHAGSDLHLLHGDSHDQPIIEQAAELGPYQFVFIDADHRYEAVKQDWQNYSPMVAPGGIVAFHDIVARRGYGVAELWAEIKAVPGTRWMEIVQTVAASDEKKCGIGVVWM